MLYGQWMICVWTRSYQSGLYSSVFMHLHMYVCFCAWCECSIKNRRAAVMVALQKFWRFFSWFSILKLFSMHPLIVPHTAAFKGNPLRFVAEHAFMVIDYHSLDFTRLYVIVKRISVFFWLIFKTLERSCFRYSLWFTFQSQVKKTSMIAVINTWDMLSTAALKGRQNMSLILGFF